MNKDLQQLASKLTQPKQNAYVPFPALRQLAWLLSTLTGGTPELNEVVDFAETVGFNGLRKLRTIGVKKANAILAEVNEYKTNTKK